MSAANVKAIHPTAVKTFESKLWVYQYPENLADSESDLPLTS